MVERFSGSMSALNESENGWLVRHSDYAALEARCAEYDEELAGAAAREETLKSEIDELRDRIEREPVVKRTATNDQIAAVMLQSGNEAQVAEALAYVRGKLASSPECEPVVKRNLAGETVNGVPVFAWAWEVPTEFGPIHKVAFHWSTPPSGAIVIRLVDAAALASAPERVEAEPVAWIKNIQYRRFVRFTDPKCGSWHPVFYASAKEAT